MEPFCQVRPRRLPIVGSGVDGAVGAGRMRVVHSSSRFASARFVVRAAVTQGTTTPCHAPRDQAHRMKATMNHDHTTRYRIELDVLERDSTAGDPRALALLRSELLARPQRVVLQPPQRARDRRQRALAPDSAGGRRTLRGRARAVRAHAGHDRRAGRRVVRREFQHALNASHFWRICRDDARATLVSRERVETRHALRVSEHGRASPRCRVSPRRSETVWVGVVDREDAGRRAAERQQQLLAGPPPGFDLGDHRVRHVELNSTHALAPIVIARSNA